MKLVLAMAISLLLQGCDIGRVITSAKLFDL